MICFPHAGLSGSLTPDNLPRRVPMVLFEFAACMIAYWPSTESVHYERSTQAITTSRFMLVTSGCCGRTDEGPSSVAILGRTGHNEVHCIVACARQGLFNDIAIFVSPYHIRFNRNGTLVPEVMHV